MGCFNCYTKIREKEKRGSTKENEEENGGWAVFLFNVEVNGEKNKHQTQMRNTQKNKNTYWKEERMGLFVLKKKN
jgi:hypothetical protein